MRKTKRPAKAAPRAAKRASTSGRVSRSALKPLSDKDVVLAAAQRLETAVARGNRGGVDKLLAREFSFIDASGKTHSRARVLASLKAAPRPGTTGLKIKTYGRVALVSGASKSAQASKHNDLFAVDIWVKDDAGWRALIHHNNVLPPPGAAPTPHGSQEPRSADAPPPACDNPLNTLPYKPKSQAERDIITAFQTLEGAVTRNDADEWVQHMADEFVVYRTRQHPTTKAERANFIRSLARINAETYVAAVDWMKLWVLGDAAVMRADHVMPGNRRPPYRATRLWVKRDGRWQMAMSQQTTMVE